MKKSYLLFLYFATHLIPLNAKFLPPFIHGNVTHNKTKKVLYNEEHQVSYKNGLIEKIVTVYKNPSGKKIGKLTSIFHKNAQLPDTEFIDKRTGIKERTTLKKGIYGIETTNEKGQVRRGNIDVVDNLVCGQGYHNYIVKNFDNFKVGEQRKVKFVIPSIRDYFTFTLTYLGALNPKKSDEVSFRLDITNWILSMFADSFQVTYSKKNKTLIKYVGLTNLKNSKNNHYDATINYTYPEKK